ncbi:MAG: DUF1320 domain-containing protein [Rhizobiaceae bacterium]
MPYCTQQELEDRYSTQLLIDISDRGTVQTGAIDTYLITAAIADADAVIDGYLKPIYALPLVETPNVIASISKRIAIYNAHSNVVSDKIEADFKNAMAQLKDISSGKLKLDVAGVEPDGSGAAEVQTNDPVQTFSASTMKDFI